MTHPFYLEKSSEDIYEEFLQEDDGYQDEDERQSDRMADMISKYGNY
jgi:hypothetical protein